MRETLLRAPLLAQVVAQAHLRAAPGARRQVRWPSAEPRSCSAGACGTAGAAPSHRRQWRT
eukprot:9901730-Alexandrium_andersonii.AAC.1